VKRHGDFFVREMRLHQGRPLQAEGLPEVRGDRHDDEAGLSTRRGGGD
jgi:hypothetical protein